MSLEINVVGNSPLPRSGYVLQPRVAALRGYPGIKVLSGGYPEGVVSGFSFGWSGRNPVGVEISTDCFPRVAAKRDNPGL
jgi:hypothetical protein